jgi:DNA polymerase-3 subunit alpha
MPADFIHLRARSTYSLLEGAMRVKPLVELAVKHRMPALALTDTNNLFASLDFSLTASGSGVQPIMGCILSFASEDESARSGPPEELLLLAATETGYLNLMALCSRAHLESDGASGPLLPYGALEGKSQGLIGLSGGIYGGIGRRLLCGNVQAAEALLARFLALFPNRFYLELMRHGLEAEARIEAGVISLAQAHHVPLVATCDIHFSDPTMFEAHDALLCIKEGRYVPEADRRRLTESHCFQSPEAMKALFSDLPEATENTLAIAKRCAVMAEMRAPILPRFAEDEAETLRQEARRGLEERLSLHVFTQSMDGKTREERAIPYRARLEFEIDTIIAMQFPGYFLIVSDFIRWSKDHGIPVGPGRGSGAGSVVAWALRITDLDPLKYGLLFERFLNPERVSMPDFDVDFCQDRRDEVIRYVQKRYGADRVAQIITFGKLQARAVLRDVGRVLQLPYAQVDRLCKFVPNNPAHPVTLAEALKLEPALEQAKREDENVEKLIDIALKLEGLNRHASTHAAGVVIGDRPLEQLVPIYRDPKSDMRVVQYSMKYAEMAGLVKFDFLGLKTLTVLQKAVDLIAERETQIDLLQLPENDPVTYAMLGRGDTTGVFQLESAGMRDTLKRMKPDCLEDIIALVSLYRPGPMDNIPTYINRKHGLEKAEYLHPKLETVLKETFGVIIYQEQVMQIAQVLAGYSLGEADLLRRAMGKKIRAEMEAQRAVFTERAVKNQVPQGQATAIFDLIAKFAEYGFNKSHAAAYALIAYQTAYLKANHPVAFFAASMTCDLHNTDKLATLREEAERAGITLLPPDINRSHVHFAPEGARAIRYGLAAVRNVGEQAMQAVVRERAANGPYRTPWDMAARLDGSVVNRRQLEYLIKAGALDGLHDHRAQLLAGAELIVLHNAQSSREKETKQVSLFGSEETNVIPLPAWPVCEAISASDRMKHENEALGFYLSGHPMQAYRAALDRLHIVKSSQLPDRLGPQYASIRVAGQVSGLKVKSSAKGRFAFLTLSDEGGVFELSIFKEEILSRYRDRLVEGALIVATADGKREEAGNRLILQSMESLEDAIKTVQGKLAPKALTVTLRSPDALPALKALLGESLPNGTQITVQATLDAHHAALIRLPQRYFVSPVTLAELAAMRHVAQVREER